MAKYEKIIEPFGHTDFVYQIDVKYKEYVFF